MTQGDGRTGRERQRPRPVTAVAGRLVLKVALLGIANGLGFYGAAVTYSARSWGGLAAIVVATVAIDVVYLSGLRTTPLKYLVPGTVFLLVFQVYPVLYNTYIAFTNYGVAHNLTKSQAIERIQANNLLPTETGERYAAAPAENAEGELALILVVEETGDVLLGTVDGLEDVDDQTAVLREDDRIVAVGEYRRLSLREAQDRQADLQGLVVPVEDGGIRLQTFTTASAQAGRIVYDESVDAMVDVRDGTLYRATGGNFVAEDGRELQPGWREVVGWANFTRVLGSPAIRGPFVRVFLWTIAFASLSVLTTFALGVLLALALDHPLLRFRRVYRSLLLFPYALPSFMTALIWAGLLNERFGAVNRTLGLSINWLGDPWLAKVSAVLVNLWLGFPYMFLVSTGALQAIPKDLKEAAFIDGAGGWQAFRRVTLPLLLIPLSPLLIASFAFNFNNFNVIFLLNEGGPPIVGARTPAGHTDILISYTYRLAFAVGTGADYGLAAAITVFIFFMVATISVISFRRTRSFEEIA